MNKNTMDLITFIFLVISIGIYIFTLNLLAFGFSILFCSMFAIDSFMYFIKKKFIDPKHKAIGGELK